MYKMNAITTHNTIPSAKYKGWMFLFVHNHRPAIIEIKSAAVVAMTCVERKFNDPTTKYPISERGGSSEAI
jgi:hypothetical protein